MIFSLMEVYFLSSLRKKFPTPNSQSNFDKKEQSWIYIASSTRGQTAEARRTTILQPVEQKPHSQKDRQDEKAEGYVPDEGTR